MLPSLSAYAEADVVEPSIGFGQPVFVCSGARVDAALAIFRAGEPLDAVAEEYGVPRHRLEDAVRVPNRLAA